MKINNTQSGFSLVELAIGLAVITVLILAISLSAGIRDNARVQSAAQSIQTLRSAAESYLTSGKLNYAGITIATLKQEGILPDSFDASNANPWGGSYAVAPSSNNTRFDIVLGSVPAKDSVKLKAYFMNTATGADYDDSKGTFTVTF